MWSPGQRACLPETVPASPTAPQEVCRGGCPEQVPLHVVDALEEDLDRGQAPFSRRVVLHPQSSGVQDRSPDMSMSGNRFAALAGAETVSMPDMDDAVATFNQPKCHCPRVLMRNLKGSAHVSVVGCS